MKKILKWLGIVIGSLVGLLLLIIAVLYGRGAFLLNKSYTIPVEPISAPADEAALERGKHLSSFLCAECHGEDLGGVVNWFSSPELGAVDSANLTSGEGGIAREFTSVEDYVRAIRHGVDPEGKPIYMPGVLAFNHMSDADLAAVVAYLNTVPPVDRITRGNEQLTPLAILLVGAGQFPMPAELVDHTNQHPVAPPIGVTPEYGQYLAVLNHCDECHGPQLSGGRHPDPRLTIFGPNLTPGGLLASWSEEQFISAMRTGVVPTGRQLSEYMPWKMIGRMTDDELHAVWLYLQSLPALSSTYQ